MVVQMPNRNSSDWPMAGGAASARARALSTFSPMEPFVVAHFSDTHLGYEAYSTLSVTGNNQRGEDTVRAFVNVCKEIIAADPPLVIHSGDVADRVQIPIRYMLLARRWFSELAGLRPDGTRRQLVVIAGNHELPRNHKDACFLELYRGLPGVHVVTTQYEQITFDEAEGASDELAGVVVHCVPHDTLKDLARSESFDDVAPVAGKTNILTAHGVAGGSELYARSLGREFAIPTDVLGRDWDYGALGHWHKQGPIPLTATGATSSDTELGRIWYAGSTENMGFRDLRDNGTKRGWLEVTVTPGSTPVVSRHNVAIRAMFRLPVLDVSGLSPDEIATGLRARVHDAEVAGELNGAVVAQILTGVTRDVWSLVDIAGVKRSASGALHYEVTVRFAHAERSESGGVAGLGDLAAILVARAAEILGDDERDDALNLARTLLGGALAAESPEAGDGDQHATAEDPRGGGPGGVSTVPTGGDDATTRGDTSVTSTSAPSTSAETSDTTSEDAAA